MALGSGSRRRVLGEPERSGWGEWTTGRGQTRLRGQEDKLGVTGGSEGVVGSAARVGMQAEGRGKDRIREEL